MSRIALLLALFSPGLCSADIINFGLDSDGGGSDSGNAGSIAGTVFTLTENLSVDGVDFDATLTAIGSGSLGHNTSGLGVGGNTINDGESVSFAVTIDNLFGGTVSFDGFTLVDFNSFTISGDDQGVLSVDNSLATVGDNTTLTGDLGDFSVTGSPSTFTIFGTPQLVPGGMSTSFQLNAVALAFTGTAIPEPSGIALYCSVAIGLIGLRWNRRRRNHPTDA